MFQSAKKRAEMEQELISQQKKLQDFTRAIENIMKYSDKAFDFAAELEQEQTSIDNALTHVVEHMKEIRAGEKEQSAKESEILKRMEQLNSGLAESKNGYRSFLGEVKAQHEELLKIAEQSKNVAEPTRLINQAAGDMGQDMDKMLEGLDSMLEFGKQMGVLSLGATIEAGRMGDGGRKFVAAAEEVRSFAGKYKEAAQDVVSQVEQMKRRLKEAQEQIEYLTGLVERNNSNKEKAVSSLKECIGGIEEKGLSEEFGSIWEDMKATATVTDAHETYFEQTLQAMEQAGESFMRERQLKEQMKDELKRVQLEAGKLK